MALTKVTGELVDIGDLDISNVGSIQLDSIAGDADSNTSITFSGSDVITIATGGSGRLTIGDGALSPVTDNQIDLGTSSLEFKDAFFDGTVTADAFAGPITGDLTGTLQTAAQTNITSLGTLTALTVQKASSGASATSGTVLTVEDDDNTELSILGGSSSVLAINFGHSGDNDEGKITFNTTAGSEDLQLVSSKAITLDATGDIILDADDADIRFRDGGAGFFTITNSSLDAVLKVEQSDEDLLIKGNDGGTEITALTLDMSDAGTATFNHDIKLGDNGQALFGAGDDLTIYHDGSDSYIKDTGTGNLLIQYSDLYFSKDAGSTHSVVFRSTGNVGIGTTSPGAHLDVGGGDIADPTILIDSAAGGDPTIDFNGVANRDAVIRFKENGTQVGQITYVCNGDYLKFSAGSNNNSSKFIVYGTGHATLEDRLGLTGVAASSDIAINMGTGTAGDVWRIGTHVSNTTSYWINDDNDGVYMTYGGTSWSVHSDERIKENITSLGTVLPDLVNMRCVKYNKKGKSDTKIGFIAQDWESKFPEVVDEDDGFMVESNGSIVAKADTESTDKVKSVAYTETIPILLKAIQELEARIKTLEDG